MNEPLNLSGFRSGKLVAIERVANSHGKACWKCLCDCGNEVVIGASRLNRGRATACGCNHKKHGMFSRPTYTSWNMMRRRCMSDYATGSKNYLGRGVKVCHQWEDFRVFLKDMGERPAGTSLDRIDNDGDYEPSNCRWATKFQQAHNASRAKMTSTTGLLGVSRNGSGFCARIVRYGKTTYIGQFRTAHEAHAAYMAHKELSE